MEKKMLAPGEMVAAQWPLDGPYDPERLASAMEACAELVRWANYATLSTTSEALPSAPEVYPTLGYLSSLPAGFKQLLGQLGTWAEGLAGDPSLRSDQTHDHEGGAAAAQDAAAELRAAAVAVTTVRRHVAAAHSMIGRLYHDEA
ncbi:hypothetical protein [Amycolatopsis sp. FDAARGOS 1241]|uniref:hypothetical protein n=1 Tax=Amycolatopsis sp. FDAARGOS 1241 TaxID=2778070 RepID=UPI001950C727|nr:hypothetical protein [Amycolatopsis sp. FDAARGOS 1241]QRP42757.1 hypothetical protein I6J71_25085 [Amycolatopsis sp. FDAARGOS 1241]